MRPSTDRRFATQPLAPPALGQNFDVYVWVALFAPAGTLRPIIDRIAGDVAKALESPDIKQRFAGAGIEGGTGTPDGLATFMKKNFELWDKLIKSQGLRLD